MTTLFPAFLRTPAVRKQLPLKSGSSLGEASDGELLTHSRSLRFRAMAGEPLHRLAPEAFALVREAARRRLGMEHYDVQFAGGWQLFRGRVAEMETGEGKTLTATLPLYLMALPGRGAHLATVNDYLAERDAEWMGPIYRMLGLTVGVIQSNMEPAQRRRAYACDITYGTAKEFGFDFLKDRLLLRSQGKLFGSDEPDGNRYLGLRPTPNGTSPNSNTPNSNTPNSNTPNSNTPNDHSRATHDEQPMQRAPFFALVDEADSVLIDEARTPLIISAIPGDAQAKVVAAYRWAAAVAGKFSAETHFEYEFKKRRMRLTDQGRRLVRELPKPEPLGGVGLIDLYEFVERALKVEREFASEQHYVVRDGEVVIVDEYTGRLAEGRRWSGGIHQAVEAKEGVDVTVETGHAARITVQDFFLRYPHLAGMTGTARASAGELKRIYRLPVRRIPTNRPVQRRKLPTRVFATESSKWSAVAKTVADLHQRGVPVLIGTRSIDRSQRLAAEFNRRGIEHVILNARYEAEEAEIVKSAGHRGRVTVATNMAGRGTDIQLGSGVPELGGLHVILTEFHESSRIDRQLMGRCGRQGDPGTYQQFAAMDDELLVLALGPEKAARIATRAHRMAARQANHNAAAGLEAGEIRSGLKLLRRAQRRLERKHFRDRRVLLYHERQRRKMLSELGRDPYLDSVE